MEAARQPSDDRPGLTLHTLWRTPQYHVLTTNLKGDKFEDSVHHQSLEVIGWSEAKVLYFSVSGK